ncbi:MAG: HD domain-containing protein [Spirochaetaceae bacterium]|nr:MAG: HD domain-containing protein [Spirochaetaceae bacterium]
MSTTKSPKEAALDRRLLELLPDSLSEIAQKILQDDELKALQDYANVVSIKRLGYNDHGPVHMRMVAKNALKFANLLRDAGIPMSLEAEGIGSFEDSVFAVFTAALLHDVGMSVARQDHERHSVLLGKPIIERFLELHYPGDMAKQVTLRSLICECIVGHMAMVRIHSLEAGLILVADGCDMEKGRARIPMLINTEARLGDIHKYSSAAVERVLIGPGEEKPIAIEILMTASVGLFQIEEVLSPKLGVSPARPYIELYARIADDDRKRYL